MAHRPSPSLSLPRLAGHLDVNYCTINLLLAAAIIFSDSPVQRPRRLVVRKDWRFTPMSAPPPPLCLLRPPICIHNGGAEAATPLRELLGHWLNGSHDETLHHTNQITIAWMTRRVPQSGHDKTWSSRPSLSSPPSHQYNKQSAIVWPNFFWGDLLYPYSSAAAPCPKLSCHVIGTYATHQLTTSNHIDRSTTDHSMQCAQY